jgi:uncharacterized repeat protein (TIGR02543 family)
LLTVDVSPAGTGIVKLYGTEASKYPASTPILESKVLLEAVPAPGYQFDSWTGSINSKDNPLSLMMDCPKIVIANFSLLKYTLTVQTDGNGSTEPVIGSHSYAPGSVVDIVAIPDSGWRFDGWTGDVADPTSTTTTVKVAADIAVTANFKQSWLIWWLVGGGLVFVLTSSALVHMAVRHRRAGDKSTA